MCDINLLSQLSRLSACLHASMPRRCHWPRVCSVCVLRVCVCAWPTAEFSQFSSISQRRLLAILQVANCELHFHNLIKSRIDCCPSRRDVACQLAMAISHISPLNEPPRPARERQRQSEGGRRNCVNYHKLQAKWKLKACTQSP